MLRDNGVMGVSVHRGAEGQDHFDPRTNSIALSPSVYDHSTVTAYATACHEVGHACQFAQGYAPLKIRSAIVPAVNLASNAWVFVLIAGIVMNLAGLIDVAIILYAAVVLFQLVTLPVEFNASRRAMAALEASGAYTDEELHGARKVLRAAAMTYVAALAVSLLQILRLVILSNSNRRR
jgi:Zn-dependent membrane protease YugP